MARFRCDHRFSIICNTYIPLIQAILWRHHGNLFSTHDIGLLITTSVDGNKDMYDVSVDIFLFSARLLRPSILELAWVAGELFINRSYQYNYRPKYTRDRVGGRSVYLHTSRYYFCHPVSLMTKISWRDKLYIDNSVQDCTISGANALGILQSCIEPLISCWKYRGPSQ